LATVQEKIKMGGFFKNGSENKKKGTDRVGPSP
jgi:hypothetical protein